MGGPMDSARGSGPGVTPPHARRPCGPGGTCAVPSIWPRRPMAPTTPPSGSRPAADAPRATWIATRTLQTVRASTRLCAPSGRPPVASPVPLPGSLSARPAPATPGPSILSVPRQLRRRHPRTDIPAGRSRSGLRIRKCGMSGIGGGSRWGTSRECLRGRSGVRLRSSWGRCRGGKGCSARTCLCGAGSRWLGGWRDGDASAGSAVASSAPNGGISTTVSFSEGKGVQSLSTVPQESAAALWNRVPERLNPKSANGKGAACAGHPRR